MIRLNHKIIIGLSKRPVWSRAAVCLGLACISWSALNAAQQAAQSLGPDFRFYLRLKNEEFMRMMLPKESFLLGMVRNVHEEIKSRKADGRNLAPLGIDALISPKQMLMEAYSREIERVIGLFGEISQLEMTARRRADVTVLQLLSELRKQTKAILDAQTFIVADAAGLGGEARPSGEPAAGPAATAPLPPSVSR